MQIYFKLCNYAFDCSGNIFSYVNENSFRYVTQVYNIQFRTQVKTKLHNVNRRKELPYISDANESTALTFSTNTLVITAKYLLSFFKVKVEYIQACELGPTTLLSVISLIVLDYKISKYHMFVLLIIPIVNHFSKFHCT